MVRGSNKTGSAGVRFHAQSGKYMANIMVKGRRVILGYFETATDAGTAYASAKNAAKNGHNDIMRRVVWYKAYAANKAEARKDGVVITPREIGPRHSFDDYEFYGGHLGVNPPVWRNGQKFSGGRRVLDTPNGEVLETIDMVFDEEGRYVGCDDNVVHDLWAKYGVGPKAVADLV